jgi:hypothetical protein
VVRTDPLASLTATLDFQISGDDFGGTLRAQQVVLDLDLNVSGGIFPTTFTEGFEARHAAKDGSLELSRRAAEARVPRVNRRIRNVRTVVWELGGSNPSRLPDFVATESVAAPRLNAR